MDKDARSTIGWTTLRLTLARLIVALLCVGLQHVPARREPRTAHYAP